MRQGGRANPSTRTPHSSCVEGLTGPRTAVRPRDPSHALTSPKSAPATAGSGTASKNPKNPAPSPHRARWRRLTIPAMRPTPAPPQRARNSRASAWAKNGSVGARRARSSRRSGGTHRGSSRYSSSGKRRKARSPRRPSTGSTINFVTALPRAPTLSDDPQALAHLAEGRQDPIEVLRRVGRHVAGPDQRPALGHGRAHRGVAEDPLLPEELPEPEGEAVIFQDHRDDVRLAAPRIEPQGAEFPLHEPGVLPQALAPLRLVLDHVQRRADRRDARGGEAGAEDEGARLVLEVVDHSGRAGHEAPDGSQRLAAGPHHQVHLFLDAEVFRGPPAALPEDAGGVGVVHHDPGAVGPGEPDDLGQVRDVPLHAEHPIHPDQFPPAPPPAMGAPRPRPARWPRSRWAMSLWRTRRASPKASRQPSTMLAWSQRS